MEEKNVSQMPVFPFTVAGFYAGILHPGCANCGQSSRAHSGSNRRSFGYHGCG
jgi:hypothetical protein